jgi:hypothetical protein
VSYEVLTKTVEIDGETYEIRILDAITGYRVYVKLLNAVGGALEGAGALKGGSGGELALKVLGSALANLKPELAEELRSTFAKSCCLVKDGKKPELKDVFLLHFRARYAHMSKWMLECVKANFADFLADESNGNSNPLEQLKAMFQGKPPTASTGSSSES